MKPTHKTEKKLLREQAGILRSSLAQDQTKYNMYSRKVQENLLSSSLWEKCKNVCLYYAVRGEVNTDIITQTAWAENKNAFFPLCNPSDLGVMDFLQCQSVEDFQDGLFKIPEPKPKCRIASIQEMLQDPYAIILVPALAFDREGYRLGYGRGYYDRYLSAAYSITSIGLAFEEHLFSELPRDSWDKAVTYLCTNETLTKV